MTIETAPVRSAAVLAVQVLDDEQVSQTDRIERVRALLVQALTASAVMSPADRAALDATPTVQAALARIAADAEPSYVAGPDGMPTNAVFVRDPNARPVDDALLRALGF